MIYKEDPPVEITLEDGQKVIRKGACSGCGFCCKVIVRAGIDGDEIEDQEFAEVRGYPKKGEPMKWYNAYDPCPLLDAANRCKIYANRPRTCKDFPIHPDQIVDSPCSYRFYDEDGNEISPGRNYEGYEEYDPKRR